MKAALALFGTLAMVPAMIGPLEAEARALAAPLCGGGMASIPVQPVDAPPGPQQGPCCAKGCQTGSSRKRLDRAQ